MRLFYALKFDINSLPLMKTALLKLKKDAGEKEWDLKFIPVQSLHITLRFLGNCQANELDRFFDIGDRVANLHHGFQLQISGFDAFPEIHQARVIWAGVQNKKNLQAIHQDLDSELKLWSMPPENEYLPHLTVARLRNPRSVKDYLSPFQRKSFGSMDCKELGLFKSELKGNYPHYDLLRSFKLKDHINNDISDHE